MFEHLRRKTLLSTAKEEENVKWLKDYCRRGNKSSFWENQRDRSGGNFFRIKYTYFGTEWSVDWPTLSLFLLQVPSMPEVPAEGNEGKLWWNWGALDGHSRCRTESLSQKKATCCCSSCFRAAFHLSGNRIPSGRGNTTLGLSATFLTAVKIRL